MGYDVRILFEFVQNPEPGEKVLTLFGTRPEAIPANCAGLCKLAPVIRELRRHPDRVVCKVCVTV